jgi:hypothetical protein
MSLLLVGCIHQAPRDVDPAIRGVYEASRAIEGALAVGVTYPDFGTLIRDMSKQLLLARDRLKYGAIASDAAVPKILGKYGELLIMYQDSAKVWQLQIQEKGKYDSELPAIAAKYGVSSAIREWKDRSYGITTTEKQIDYDRIRQAIWEKSSRVQEEQAAEAYGTPVAPATRNSK